ncbi:MAG: FecR family protein [Chitinophagaceae bacterium]|nr:FecR family protein [Chitinophagaceae bacterium]
MHSSERLIKLFEKYIADACTDEELAELFEYIGSTDYDSVQEKFILQKLRSPLVEGSGLDAIRSQLIVGKILATQEENTTLIRNIGRKRMIRRITVAAALLVLLIGSIIFSGVLKRGSEDLIAGAASLTKDNQRVINTSGKPMKIQLEDGSHVILQPSATLVYPPHFSGGRREVALDGEAFFDIAKHPGNPFMVYHNDLITRVLGTSFYIRHDENTNEVAVEVITGKVEVYENEVKINPHGKKTKNSGVIITPNQKVLYIESKHLFSTSLVNNPMPVLNKASAGDSAAVAGRYDLDKVPLATIIGLLTTDYGIEIELENEALNNCLFTGDIGDPSLYSKLDIICRAIGISYEIKGTKILIKGKGCI